ncbi:MAG: TonB C-terminal domain-containing protein [Elusimicrobia bacterium]|nr:TonB C-terminal domain-containing protein [Elusimicrobiota bacterium]
MGHAAAMSEADELKPYLKASAATHVVLVAAALAAATMKPPAREETYRIDFIGPTAGIANREPEAAPASAPQAARPAAKPPPMKPSADFVRRRPNQPLPKPSFLQSGAPEPAPKAEPAPAAPAAAAPAAPSSGKGDPAAEGSGASVSSDMPNFPYPWYITQVRSRLWANWSSNMPRSPGAVTVMFTILRDGSLTDIRVESSSGDAGYDYIALTAVQNSAPFGPLPSGFKDSFLKIHVNFTSQ